MKTIILFFAVILTLVSGQILNRQCSAHSDCGGNNWVCKDLKCKCGISYRQGNQQDCVPILTSTCEADDECENLPGALCENNKCICKQGYIPDIKECRKIGGENEECIENEDCIQRTQDDQKECKNKMCVCKAGLHEGNNKKCKKTLALNDKCTSEDDCFQADSLNNNVLQCLEAEGQSKVCKCKDGYKEEGDKCNGSAAKFILSASSLLLLVLAVIKM